MYKIEDGKNEIPNLVESNDELAHCWKFYILAVIMLVAYTLGHRTLNTWTGKGKRFFIFAKKKHQDHRNCNVSKP